MAICWVPAVHRSMQDALQGDCGLWVLGESRSSTSLHWGMRSLVWLGHGGSACHPNPHMLAGGTVHLWLGTAAVIWEWA